MLSWLVSSFGWACVTAWLLVSLLIRKAPVIGLIDRPTDRGLHTRSMPRGGGLGFVVAWLIGYVVWMYFRGIPVIILGPQTVFFGTASVIAGVSLWDDFCSIGAGLRIVFHLVCASTIIATFGCFYRIDIGAVVYLGSLAMFITAIWIVGLTNVFNFMDGIDGIAGVQGLVAGIAWCIAGKWAELQSISVLGALLAGGCAGFLLHNWAPAKIFMGDVGSAFLGFVYSVMPLLALHELPRGSSLEMESRLPSFAIIVVWPFVADGLFTFLRRLFRNEPVWKPHRSHLYQRMVQAGWTHARVTSYYGLWAIVCAAVGMRFLKSDGASLVWGIAVLFAVFTWMLTLYLEKR